MGSITNVVLSRDEVTRVDQGALLVPLRVPWYRSLPLSSLEHLAITVDGQTFADDQLSLDVGGTERPFAALKDNSYEFWFVQDTAWARVPVLPVRDTVLVRVEAFFRIPYILLAPHRAMVRQVSSEGACRVEGVN